MTDDPLLALHGEHEAIRPRLRTLEKALDAAMNRGQAVKAELAVFQETVDFLRTDVFVHFRREEKALLPLLEDKVGRYGSLVSVIAYDHDEVRREVAKLGEALAVLQTAVDRPHRSELLELNRHGIFLVQYLALHMAKEDSSLAEVARQALGEEGLREVARRLEEIG